MINMHDYDVICMKSIFAGKKYFAGSILRGRYSFRGNYQFLQPFGKILLTHASI